MPTMNPGLVDKLQDWLLLTFSVVVVTYVVSVPVVWFACTVWVGMGYRESLPPAPEVLEAQIWREFVRTEVRLPLVFWPWFTFIFGVIALGVGRDVCQLFKPKS